MIYPGRRPRHRDRSGVASQVQAPQDLFSVEDRSTYDVVSEVNVDTADSQHLSRISKMLLAGTGVAFAWVLLSFALGFSASQAHAEEDPGLLGTVTGTVADTTTATTEVVTDTASSATPTVTPVVQTVTPVVQTVATAAPALPVAPVVEIVDDTVAPVVSTVTEVTDAGVVAPIVDSALGVVAAVPVVGGAVDAIGADDALASAGSSVDGVLQATTGAVIGTASDVVDIATGSTTNPAVPPVSAVSDLLAGALGSVAVAPRTDAAAGPLETLAHAAYLTGAAAWLSLTSQLPASLSSPDSAAVSGGEIGGALALLRSVLQADSALSGSAGAGPGAWVLVALGFVVAYRAWMRRTGSENDVAPPAPAYSTDVSPD